MYIPSLDPETIREEAVRVLNPLGFPQPVTDITADTVLSFGYPPAEIAARTGFAQLVPLKEGETDQVSATSSLTATGEKTTDYHRLQVELGARGRLNEQTFAHDAASSLSADTASAAEVRITNSRLLTLTKTPKRELLLTVALPYRPDEVPDVYLRLWVRPLNKPLLSAEGEFTGDPLVSPSITLSGSSSFLARTLGSLRENKRLRAHLQGRTAFGEEMPATLPPPVANQRLSARLTRVLNFGANLIDQISLWANLSHEERTTEVADPASAQQRLDLTAAAGSNVVATLRTRPIFVTRCATVADARTVTSTTAPADDPASPTITGQITTEGTLLLNLTPLLLADRLVYTFRLTTTDDYGFEILDRAPGAPEREPCVLFGTDTRNARQGIRGVYLGSLLSVRQDTKVSYPVPYFSAAEARRLAQAWNAVSAFDVDPENRTRLEWDSSSLRFRKYLIDDEDGEIIPVGTIDPVRIGDTLLYPIGSYDFLWTFDRTDAISKLSNRLLAASSVEADLDLLVGFDTNIDGTFTIPGIDPTIGLASARTDIDATLSAQQVAEATAAAQTGIGARLSKGDLEADVSTNVDATLRSGQVDERATTKLDATLSDGEE